MRCNYNNVYQHYPSKLVIFKLLIIFKKNLFFKLTMYRKDKIIKYK